MIDFDKLNKIVELNHSFLLTTHINPDPDAIGSELGLYYYLKKLGKQVIILNISKTPGNLTFLDPQNIISTFNYDTHNNIFKNTDVLAALDFNQLDRIGEMQELFRGSSKLKICIDHHELPGNFSENLFVDTSYSSTGEIIYDLIRSNNKLKIDYDIAVQLYAAIMTDTGSFRFERTSAKIHRIAAEFLEVGIDPGWIYREIYEQGTVGKIKLLGKALSSIELNDTGEICSISVCQSDLSETNTTEEDIDGFVNYCLSIKGVKIALLFFELADGFKISFRSVGDIPANKLAAEFGGGGHYHAAGARVKNKLVKNYKSEVIEAAKKFLK